MDESREKLEMKISYLEAEVAELNELVIEQNRTIDVIQVQMEQMKKKIEDLIEETGDGERPSRRPPHY